MATHKHKSKAKAKKKSGSVVEFAKAGKRKGKARKKHGFGSGFESWKGALLASAAMRFISGGVAYVAKTQNLGQELPKVKMIAPLIIAYLAKNNIIPMPGLFPAAIQSFVDAGVDNTKFLKDIADFRFMDSKPAGGREALPASGMFYELPAPGLTSRQGFANSLQSQMNNRGYNFRK